MGIAAVAAVVCGGGAAMQQAFAAGGGAAKAQDTGGLSISPTILSHAAQPGPVGGVVIVNRSAAPLAVTVTPRPWLQSSDGKVVADRKRTLTGVTLSSRSFTLAPGATQEVDATLAGTPSGGSLYGALEVVGLPTDASTRTGVVLGYRLIETVRLLPAVAKHSLKASALTLGPKHSVLLPVTNTGNTLDPVSGTASLKGARGTVNGDIGAMKIVPGAKVGLSLGSALKRGGYSVKVVLKQGGKTMLTVKRKFTVK
jgi:hypothetical protein